MSATRVIRAGVFVVFALCAASPAWVQAQSLAGAGTVPPAARVSVTTSAGEPVVSAGPGAIGCRALITEIARQTRLRVQNLGTVPDDVVFVQIRDASVAGAVSSVLRLAKVDYVLRQGEPGGAPSLLLIAGHRAGGLSASMQGGYAPPALPVNAGPDSSFSPAPVDLPDVEPADEGASPTAVPLDVRPEVIEIGPAPTWQAIDATPTPVPVPADMVPTPFAVTAPPAVSAPAAMPSPPPARAPGAAPGTPAPMPSRLPTPPPPR